MGRMRAPAVLEVGAGHEGCCRDARPGERPAWRPLSEEIKPQFRTGRTEVFQPRVCGAPLPSLGGPRGEEHGTAWCWSVLRWGPPLAA